MTTDPSTQDRLIDALHNHFMLDALGPIGCECPKASDEEHVAAFVLDHLAAQETDLARKAGECPTCHGDVHVDMAGAIWTTTNEPTDAEVLAALNAQGVVVSPKMRPAPSLDYWGDKPAEAMRAALSAARAARRDEEAR